MKRFTRIEPTIQQEFGLRFKRAAVIKRFRTEDGAVHEFTTIGGEGERTGGVIALTPDKRVITTYQFRAGPERWMYDLPGGWFRQGEVPKIAAMRELEEETGYTSKKVIFLGKNFGGAYTNPVWYFYLALDCEMSTRGRKLDDEEKAQGAEVRLITIDQFINNAKRGRMTDPQAVLMAYDRLKEIQNGQSY